MTSTRSAELAATASEAIRNLNHATISTAGVDVSEVYTVLGELAQLAHRVDQTTGQLARILDARRANGTLRLAVEETRYPSVPVAIDAATVALTAAGDAGRRLGQAFDAAQSALAWVADPVTDSTTGR